MDEPDQIALLGVRQLIAGLEGFGHESGPELRQIEGQLPVVLDRQQRNIMAL
ncbi:MAG: hypothetical protein ACREV4_02885 [Gammaproteobacteria bacterium]